MMRRPAPVLLLLLPLLVVAVQRPDISEFISLLDIDSKDSGFASADEHYLAAQGGGQQRVQKLATIPDGEPRRLPSVTWVACRFLFRETAFFLARPSVGFACQSSFLKIPRTHAPFPPTLPSEHPICLLPVASRRLVIPQPTHIRQTSPVARSTLILSTQHLDTLHAMLLPHRLHPEPRHS